MESKNEGNENNIIPGDFNCTIDEMDRCCSYYTLNVDNGLRIYGEGRTQIPLSSPTMTDPLSRIQIDRIYNDIKIANNTKRNHIMISWMIIIMLFLLTDSLQQLKLEKVHGVLIILFYVSPTSPPVQSHFKENAKYYPKTPPLKKILEFQD